MNRERVDEWLTWAQLGVALLVLVYAPTVFGAVRPSDLVWVHWGILAMAALWVARLWIAPRFRLLLPPATWSILPFVAYAGWRYSTADVEFIARQEFLHIGFLALLVFTVVNCLYGQREQRLVAMTLVGLATLIAMYGIYQWLSHSQNVFGYQGYEGRASGSYVCPNHFAGLLELCLPIALALAIAGRFKAVPRIVFGYCALVMCVGIAASGSRGGWIAGGIAVFLLLAIVATRKGLRLVSLAFAGLIIFAGAWLYERSVAERFQPVILKGHERENRFWYWQAAYEMFRDHPWYGVGPDHFDQRYRAYRAETDKTQFRPGRAHNDYLNTLADYGVIGFALLLLPIGVSIWAALRTWPSLKRSSDEGGAHESNRGALMLGCGCAIVGILVHSVFDFNLHIPANAVIASVLWAILLSQVRFSTSRWWVTARWPVRIAMSLAVIAAIVALGRQNATRTVETLALRATEKPTKPAVAIQNYKRAVAAEPNDPEAAFAYGEYLRAIAWVGQPGYKDKTREAMTWFEKAIHLNKWDPIALIRYGMCLDFIDDHKAALPYFEKALALDPNYYYTRQMMGWHYLQTGDLRNASLWFDKSMSMNWLSNPTIHVYRGVVERALAEEKNGLPKL